MKRSPITTIDLEPSATVTMENVFRPGVFGAEPGDLHIENSTGIARICTNSRRDDCDKSATWERVSPDRLSLASLRIVKKKSGEHALYILLGRHTTRPENT